MSQGTGTLVAKKEPTADDIRRKLVTAYEGFGFVIQLYLGHKNGIFSDLVEHQNSTSHEIAERTKTNERYVRELCNALVCAGFFTCEGQGHDTKYSLVNAAIPFLHNTDTIDFSMGGISLFGALAPVLPHIDEAFRTGNGVKMSVYPDEFFHNMMLHHAAAFKHLLTQQWIPKCDEELILSKLKRGNIRVADVGCGCGGALLNLAKAYPTCTFVGFDIHEPSLKKARENTIAAKLSNIDFCRLNPDSRDLTDYNGTGKDKIEPFEIIFIFDVIHDTADPQAFLTTVRKGLKDGGTVVVLDMKGSNNPKENNTFMYTASLMYCMSTSIGNGGCGMGTCGLTFEVLEDLAKKAGFVGVRKVEVEQKYLGVQALYELRSKL